MYSAAIALTYTDQPNGSAISFETLPNGCGRFVIHPKGWIFGQHSFLYWLRTRIPRVVTIVTIVCILQFIVPAILSGSGSFGPAQWINSLLYFAGGVFFALLLGFLQDWIADANSAVIEVRGGELMVEKLFLWRVRRRILCQKFDRIIYCMGAVRFRRRGRIFDLVTVSCCGVGDQKWLARKLRDLLDIPERPSNR